VALSPSNSPGEESGECGILLRFGSQSLALRKEKMEGKGRACSSWRNERGIVRSRHQFKGEMHVVKPKPERVYSDVNRRNGEIIDEEGKKKM